MNTPAQDTRDRVIRMEQKVEDLEKKITSMDSKVTEMHTLLIQAKGARWMLMALIAVGGFVAAKIMPMLAYFIPPK